MSKVRSMRDSGAGSPVASSTRNPITSANRDPVEQGGMPDLAQLEAAGAEIAALLDEYLRLSVKAPAAYLIEAAADQVDDATPGADVESSGDDTTAPNTTEDTTTDEELDAEEEEEEVELPEPVDVTFQAPYWTNRYQSEGDYFREIVRAGVTGVLLDAEPVGLGRGSPAEMEEVVQLGLDEREIAPQTLPGPDAPLTAGDWEPILEAWMENAGVGIDCSGFVTQALMRVGSNITAFGTLTGMGPDQYASSFGSVAVEDLMTIQPLDVMYLGAAEGTGEPRHVRIVIEAETVDDGREFAVAESTFAPREGEDPARSALQGRGPRLYEYRYEGGQLYERYPHETEWRRSTEAPTYFRPVAHGAFTLPSTEAVDTR